MVWLLGLILLLSGSQGAKRKISDVYLLLPQTLHSPNARHVQYTLKAFEGCYKWSTANPKVVALTEISSERFTFDPDCQDPTLVREFQGLECNPGVLLEPVAVVEHPPVTLISAIDQTSRGETLKCEVKVGRIKRLQILTTVKSFRVQDNQRLIAQAFDDEENVFSSLEGLRFRWQIVTGAESLGLPKLKDSWATLSDVRREIENSNYQSDVILVEGKATGVANITLKIEEPGYENIPLAWTMIYISEPFALVPAPEVYIPTCSKLSFRIFKVNEHKLHKEITLPSAEYLWRVSSTEIKVQNNGLLEASNAEGKWNVIVQDSKIESNIVQCEVNVVKPDRLLLMISPFEEEPQKKSSYTQEEFNELVNPKEAGKSNWYLVSANKYRLKVVLYWRNKEISVPQNAVFSINFGETRLWEVVSRSQNSAEMVAVPVLPNDFHNNIYPTKVSAKLERFDSTGCRFDTLTDTEEANIIRRVKIVEEKHPVLLPYFAVMTQSPDKKNHLSQEYRLKVVGGSFALKWESSDALVASVAQNGVVYAHRLGKTIVTVVDANNENNRDSIEVEVSLVEKLVWEYERIEIVKGSAQVSEIKGLASGERIFHNCSSIYLDWELRKGDDLLKVKNKISVEDAQRKQGVCEIRTLEAINEGQVKISTHLIHQAAEVTAKQPEIRLSSEEGRIGIFVPLSLLESETFEIQGNNKTHTFISEKNALVLTPGSTATLELKGGPLAWSDFPDQHKEKISDTERAQVLSQKISKDKRFLQFKCPDGNRPKDYPVAISVFNERSERLKSPGLSNLDLIVACYPPFSMKLDWIRDTSDLQLANWKSLPAYYEKFRRRVASDFIDSYWVILHAQELMVNVTLWDSKSREIYNFSSVNLEWLSDKPELILYTKAQTPPNKRLTRIGDNEGPVTLEARIDRFKDGTVISPGVSSSLNNEVVKNVAVNPQSYSLYLHRQNTLEVEILHGSGYFEVSSNSTDVIVHTYDGYRKILIYPKRVGRVTVRVDDVGLPGSQPATCNILVSGLAGMELKEGGLIPVNSTTTLTLTALDSEGRLFSMNELKWMGIELSLGSAFHLMSVGANFEDWLLKGFRVGEYQVYAFGYKSQERDTDKYSVRSNVVVIDVFPPLEIIPPDVLLLPGSKYTLNYRGGPDPSKYNFYSIHTAWVMKDEKIAVIDSASGLVSALQIGDTPIALQMIRKRSLLTQAEGRIRVRLATSVGILGMGPGRTVLKDSATRLIAQVYHNGEEFSDATSSITYTWKSNSPTVYSIFQENEDTGKQIAVTGLALTGGKSDITLYVDVQYPLQYKDSEHLFSSKATASVDPGLVSQPPSHRCHSFITFNCEEEFPRWLDSTVFLIPPHSAYRLNLNKEEKTLFRCLDCREDFLKVAENGLVTSGSQKGESALVIQHSRVKGDYHVVPLSVSEVESIHIDRSHLSRSIALGSDMDFEITYQDFMARSFPKYFEYGLEVGIEVSNSRVLQASLENRNTTLKIHSQYVGETIIKVFMIKNPSVKDLIKVSVSSVMKPISPIQLHLGGEIQFETTHSTPAGITGSWSSENSNIVTVSDTGYVRSFQEGETYIHYREKSLDLKSLVLVSRVKALDLGHDAPAQITNYEKHPSFRDKYIVPIRLFSDPEKTHEFARLSEEQRKNIKQQFHIRCVTPSHSDFVMVESEMERAEKDRWSSEPGFGCVVTPIVNPTTASQAGKDLIIQVMVSSKGKSLYMFEGSVSIPFVPKFAIPGQDKQVVLTGKSITHTVLISGACGTLQINSESPLITSRKSEASGKCLVELSVIATDTDLKLKRVEIIDSITGQKEELLVSYYGDASKADLQSPMSANDFLILVAMIALVAVLYNYFKSGAQQPQVFPAGNFSQPRYPGSVPPPRNQTPGPIGPASTPGSSNFRNMAYRPNF